MKTVCNKNEIFSNYWEKIISFNFEGGNIASDGGIILAEKAMKRLGIVKKIAERIDDFRDQLKIIHSIDDLIHQRITQLVLGYEDCNDSNYLRKDPLLKTVINGLPENSKDLGSQPTFSRFENSVSYRDIFRLNELVLEMYIKKVKKRRQKEIILDIDATDDPAHGEQEGVLFNGYYEETMYLENLVFDGDTGDMIAAVLKPGNYHCSKDVMPIIRRIVKKIKAELPEVKITVRGDSGYGFPELMEYCEIQGIDFLLGLKGNPIMIRKMRKLSRRAITRGIKTGREVRYFGQFKYGAKSWGIKRSCVARIVSKDGTLDNRYIVTNMEIKSPKKTYEQYGQRGRMENYIKDLKNDMKSGRLSCHSYVANFFRLLLSCFAYTVMQEIREVLNGTELEKAQSCTIRLTLFKIGALVKETVRRVWIQLSSSFPGRDLFLLTYRRLT